MTTLATTQGKGGGDFVSDFATDENELFQRCTGNEIPCRGW